MKSFSLLIALLSLAINVQGQKYSTEKSIVTFFSSAPIEDIRAENAKTSGLFDATTNSIAFSVPIKEFQFEKSLMKEHFNEKYMESDRYPKSTFQGKVSGYDANNNQAQRVEAKGKLSIHGVTKDITIPGTIEKRGDKLLMKTKFMVKVADYKIKIPKLLWQNIAEEVEVTAEFTFNPQ